MKVKVLFFAQLRDLLGAGERTMELVDGATIEDVIRFMAKDSPRQNLAAIPLRYSVNEEFVEKNKALCDEDVVGLLPPVSGG